MIRTILSLIAVLMLSGCGVMESVTGKSDYQHYAQALSEHSGNEATRITNQSQAIVDLASESVKKSQTPAEAALQSAFATLALGQLHPVPLQIVKPTTGMDVLNSGVQHIPFVASTFGMLRLGEAGIAAAGNVTVGDNATISDSFVNNENHATGSQATATLQPKEVRPEVVIVPPAE